MNTNLWVLVPIAGIGLVAAGDLEEWEKILISLVVVAVDQIVRWIVQLLKKEKINKRWAYKHVITENSGFHIRRE